MHITYVLFMYSKSQLVMEIIKGMKKQRTRKYPNEQSSNTMAYKQILHKLCGIHMYFVLHLWTGTKRLTSVEVQVLKLKL